MLPHWNCHCCCSILLSHPQVYAHCIAYFCAFIFSLYFLNRFCFCCVLCTHTHTYASTHSLYVVCIAVATMARREELKNCSYGLLPAASWGIRLILFIYFFFLTFIFVVRVALSALRGVCDFVSECLVAPRTPPLHERVISNNGGATAANIACSLCNWIML